MHLNNRHKHENDYDKEPCAACGCDKEHTQHHIFPQAFNFKLFPPLMEKLCVWLCEACHRELEKRIVKCEHRYVKEGGYRRKLPDYWYPIICLKFITEKTDVSTNVHVPLTVLSSKHK